jgi:hypothetical protein
LKLQRAVKTTAIVLGGYVVLTQVFAWVWAEPPVESAERKLARADLLDQLSAAIGAETYRGPSKPPTQPKVRRFGVRMWNLV